MLPRNVHRFICCPPRIVSSISKQFACSSSSVSQKESLTTTRHIISDENKQRVQSQITSVHPVRSTKTTPLKDEFGNAAVLVPLCLANGEPSLLFTLRSSALNSHKGQVSFPGGHVDESDPDFIFTALRETEEELGIPPSAFDVWGQMTALPSAISYTHQDRKTLIYPILARTGEVDISKLRISEEEVEEVFTISLANLCHPDKVGSTRFRTGASYTLPVYTGGLHRIWGLTAVILHQVLTLIAPDLYKFKVRHKPYYSPQ